jgi:glycerol-3-phosphate cytidylyltransferase-like family protein
VDELVLYKNKRAVVPFDERIEIVRACRYVDLAVPQASMDKVDAWQRYRFDIMFVGDDWYGNDRWKALDAQFAELGVRIVYFPYTKTTSSTLINQTLERLRSAHAPMAAVA